MVKTLGIHASKPLGYHSKLNANGSIYHGTICDSTLDSNVMTITPFDLWISRFTHNTFALVTHFINSQWVPCHVIVGLFEAINTTRVATIMQVGDVLSSFNLLEKVIVYMKDEAMAICPPLHELLLLLLVIFLWNFQFLDMVHVLALLLLKHANMLIMILMFLLVFVRLV
jgi:hypothetical protein